MKLYKKKKLSRLCTKGRLTLFNHKPTMTLKTINGRATKIMPFCFATSNLFPVLERAPLHTCRSVKQSQEERFARTTCLRLRDTKREGHEEVDEEMGDGGGIALASSIDGVRL